MTKSTQDSGADTGFKPADELRAAARTLRQGGPIFARDATEPLAQWLETEAHMVEVRGLSTEGQTFHALKVARAINGGAR